MKNFKRYIAVVCGVATILCSAMTTTYIARADEVPDGTEPSAETTDISEDIPDIYIKAVNPGYTVDVLRIHLCGFKNPCCHRLSPWMKRNQNNLQ